MDIFQQGFLEELIQAPRNHETWSEDFVTGNEEFFFNRWNFSSSGQDISLAAANSSLAGYSAPIDPAGMECPFNLDQTHAFVKEPAELEIDGSSNDASAFPTHRLGNYPSMAEDEELGRLSNRYCFEERDSKSRRVEMNAVSSVKTFARSSFGGEKTKTKKLEGQPSKNLMAERRRRKRLNDRLSMLRSIVPKISKMDRTSILGDTIDYMKELLQRVRRMQEEETEDGDKEVTCSYLKELKPNKVSVSNSPEFQVESREMDTKVDIRCLSKPGLLLSTVNTLEALGLEIQQCVISCFDDFSMQASCSEVTEGRTLHSPEDIKHALFRAVGYGGRSL